MRGKGIFMECGTVHVFIPFMYTLEFDVFFNLLITLFYKPNLEKKLFTNSNIMIVLLLL
jgi:hypothetical protein